MKPIQIAVQLVEKKSGTRTPTVTTTRENFANKLRDHLPKKKFKSAFVLVLADDSVVPGTLDFSSAPMMTCESFIQRFSTQLVENVEPPSELSKLVEDVSF